MVKSLDAEIVKTRYVSCDGGTSELGHPKVYLEIKTGEDQIHCPYCNKLFIYKDETNSN